MKQKIVIRMSMDGKKYLPKGLECLIYVMKLMMPYETIWRRRSISREKIRIKAMILAVTCPGLTSVAIQGTEKNELVVIGEGIDASNLTKLIRRNVSFAEIVSIVPEGQKK